MTERMSTLEDTLIGLVEGVNGAPIGPDGTSRTFRALGLGPLQLTRLANSLQARTGVAIASNRLTEDLSTIGALAAHVVAMRPKTNAALDALIRDQLAAMERVIAQQLQVFVAVNGISPPASQPVAQLVAPHGE